MPLVPGSFAAWGRFFQNIDFFLKKPLVPGSFAAWGRTFSRTSMFFEEATCPRQLRCLWQNFFSKIELFLNKPLVPGSFAPWSGTFSRKSDFQEFWDSCAQNKASEISKHGLSGILGLLCAEQDVGDLKKCTFRNSGTPVRRTRRRKSQKMHFQELWDSWTQNKTSEISKSANRGPRSPFFI